MKNPNLSSMTVIFDAFDFLSEKDFQKLKNSAKQVFVMEPFVAYHRKKGPYPGFPKPFPEYIHRLIKQKVVPVILADQISAKTIYGQSTELAVQSVEAVFIAYEARFQNVFKCVTTITRSEDAIQAFKISLCEQLAEFYALNIYLHRLQNFLPENKRVFYSDINVRQYEFLTQLVKETHQTYFEHSQIVFHPQMYRVSWVNEVVSSIFLFTVLLGQSFLGFVGDTFRIFKLKKRPFKDYSYGLIVTAPNRQLKNRYGRVDFLIDNKTIKADEVVYLPNTALTSEQDELLRQLPGHAHKVPLARKYFSDGAQWFKVFFSSFFSGFPFNGLELKTAYLVLRQYFYWRKIFRDIKLQHLITQCDFGVVHIGKSIAALQAGVTTWSFTDSMNLGCNLSKEEVLGAMRHPFWTYLMYDHFVTWNDFILKFIQSHPHRIKNFHIVGCLWSQNNEDVHNISRGHSSLPSLNLDHRQKYFFIGAFDTTYSLHGFADYGEAIAFAQHLLDLVELEKDIFIFLKEKKDRKIHEKLDPLLGPKLLAIYQNMDRHPRIKVLNRLADTGEVMDQVGMVISFPFTSTTYEALSRAVPAVWHDPLSYYQETPYAKLDAIVTHGFDHLLKKVRDIKLGGSDVFFSGLPKSSDLIDPFHDQKAVNRFRELLAKS